MAKLKEKEIVCNTPYEYHGDKWMEPGGGEKVTDPSEDIPLEVILNRLQKGVPTGIGGVAMDYEYEDGDESVLDRETPHVVDPLDANRLVMEKLNERQKIQKKVSEEKKKQSDKQREEFEKWKAEKIAQANNPKPAGSETPPAK